MNICQRNDSHLGLLLEAKIICSGLISCILQKCPIIKFFLDTLTFSSPGQAFILLYSPSLVLYITRPDESERMKARLYYSYLLSEEGLLVYQENQH